MKRAGNYSRIDCDFDLDHEITKSVVELTDLKDDYFLDF